ncbi:MAG: crossover junction endodeoxyribonuclease RuvC [Thermotogae bacterium]|nr:crossover junction endodeoxyribonuclease RuvC [Thermotogota bacterium]
MRVLGIDPSLRATGWIVVERDRALAWGVIRTKGELGESLLKIKEETVRVVRQFSPDRAVMEAIIYHRNPKVAIVLGAVRGVLLLTLHELGVDVEEIPPSRLKLASTRYGQASKRQVAYILRNLYDLREDVPDHITDALAAAHYILK